MSEEKEILPNPITDFHYTMEYLSKIIGKTVLEERPHANQSSNHKYTINSVDSIQYNEINNKKIDAITFNTNREWKITIDSDTLMNLIEGGYSLFPYIDFKLKVIS